MPQDHRHDEPARATEREDDVFLVVETAAAEHDGIAAVADFPDLAGFNRRFKQTMGCTPRRYRARFRSD